MDDSIASKIDSAEGVSSFFLTLDATDEVALASLPEASPDFGAF